MKIKRIPAGIYSANCYILMDDETKLGCIIDPGGDEDILIKEIENMGVNLKLILLTHGHLDHVGGVDSIKTKYNIPIYINEKDKELIKKGEYIFGKISNWTDDDKNIKENDIIEVGNLKIKCIETPGHTPGGMSFLVENKLFTGDTLFYTSIGRTDFPGGDYSEIISSIKRKLLVLDDNTIVLPGHEVETSIKFEKQYNPCL